VIAIWCEMNQVLETKQKASDHDSEVVLALAALGCDPALRAKWIEWIRTTEREMGAPFQNIRDQVTGPLIDALHARAGPLKKRIASGLELEFHYSSRIAREFVMSPDPVPDHVWEPQTTRLLLHLAQNAKHVVVGGAYMGDHAALLAQRINAGGGTCDAFEPNAKQAEMLERNARANALGNLHVHQLALWHVSQQTLQCEGEDAEASCIDARPANDAMSFQTVTLDDFGAERHIDSIGLIMLDIEGAELQALRGATHFLKQPADRAPKIVFEIHGRYCDWSDGLQNTEIVRYLGEFGYIVFAIRDYHGNIPMGNSPIELIQPHRTHLAGPPHGFNAVAVKTPRTLESPLFRVVNDVSPKLLPHKSRQLHAPQNGWPFENALSAHNPKTMRHAC
jgi:FkbM family methyltransferase